MEKRRLSWIFDNGPCIDCGSWDNLQVDHIDPKMKKFNPAQVWSRITEIRALELAKCVVRCKACHLVKTVGELKAKYEANPTFRQHGTLSNYEKGGCRCDECLAAMREARRVQRENRGIKPRPRKNKDGIRMRNDNGCADYESSGSL